ncbi:isochorismatase [Halorubrum sp. CSM-61]|jgi:hypothetical protein|uniref:isochorismatase n=1 Tax=Halorubrum sp. CSM-61 TaxID=2485838 RepID=UPI000F4B55D6|nr:isochorismatase [Halorubrum sp. CSM-61]
MASITLSEPYQTRPIRFLDCLERDGWQIKRYGISTRGEYPPDDMVAAGSKRAVDRLPSPPVTENRYGVAVLIVHEARDVNFVSLNWWVDENVLKNVVYLSQPDTPTEFEDISETDITACVWELEVLSFERDAWVETVLANETGPDIDAYLSRCLSTDV